MQTVIQPEIRPENQNETPAHLQVQWQLRRAAFATQKGFHSGPIGRGPFRLRVLLSLVAIVLDAALILGVALIGIAIGLSQGLQELRSIGHPAQWTPAEILALYSLVISYQILARLGLQATLGEWACHIRVQVKSTRQPTHVGPVVARACVYAVCGGLPLWFFSLLSGRDWAGQWTGAYLVQSVRSSK